jgi:hypothetical protein
MSFASPAVFLSCFAPGLSRDSPSLLGQSSQPQHAGRRYTRPSTTQTPPHRVPYLFFRNFSSLFLQSPGHPFQSSSPSTATSSAPPLSRGRLAAIRGPGSYARQARMPAQKRQLPSPSSKPRDHVVEANGTDASSTGGEGGGLHLVPGGGAATNRAADPRAQRVGGELSPHPTTPLVSRERIVLCMFRCEYDG